MASKADVMTEHGSGVERAAPGEVRVRRAVLSVSDKQGVVELAKGLAGLGVEIVSTGGTLRSWRRRASRCARLRISRAFRR